MVHSRKPSPDQSIAGRLVPPVLIAFIFALVWRYDTQIYHALYIGADRRPEVESRSWYQFLKSIGTLWPWAAIGGSLILAGNTNRNIRAGILLFISAALAGGIAELLKPIVGRYRPEVSDGVHTYHASGAAKLGPYGLASSHAAVAFGAAFLILFIYPRAGIIALLLALGCAWTRLLSGAHYATDVFIGLLLGYACAFLLRPRARSSGGGMTIA